MKLHNLIKNKRHNNLHYNNNNHYNLKINNLLLFNHKDYQHKI